MWSRLKFGVAAAALSALVGCAPGIEIGKARNVVADGSEFSTSLYHGYLDLAEMEYSESDYRDADFFSRQAIRSAAGDDPEPRDIRNRIVPEDYLGRAVAGRARLMRAFKSGGKSRWPVEAARAQVMFDCWMQEQEENFQPDHIEQCEKAFIVAIGRLEAAVAKPVAPPAPKPGQQVAKQTPLGAGSGTVVARFVVFFAYDKASISPTAKRMIRDAVNEAKKIDSRRINLVGHADRSGEVPYNQSLSSQRADAVAAAMKKAGIDEAALSLAALGENSPAIQTEDGVRNYRNRRVEIEITE